jgi:hypothetical protein
MTQLQRSDQWVVDPCRAAALGPHVVSRPEPAKTLAADRELSDQFVETGIVDVRADQRPQCFR